MNRERATLNHRLFRTLCPRHRASGLPFLLLLSLTFVMIAGLLPVGSDARSRWQMTVPPMPAEPPGGETLFCYNAIINPSFERTESWTITDTMYWANYSTAQAYTGHRSMRTGIPPGGPDVRAYSSVRQAVEIPADAVSATLRLWYYPLSQESMMQEGGTRVASIQPGPGMLADRMPLDSDRQYVLLLDARNAIMEFLMWQTSNAGQWLAETYDVTAMAGMTIKPHIGTYNDGVGGITTMYVDDVTLRICRDVVVYERFMPMVCRGRGPGA
ncbi:MAG: hypothetical protein U9R25_20405 [Chloroflexota bacterium]|nr:hypothetical protein [Chloroflexota bacterium]